jgi:hypothetical protein
MALGVEALRCWGKGSWLGGSKAREVLGLEVLRCWDL